MRAVKTNSHEKGFFMRLIQLFDCPLGTFHIWHQIIIIRKYAPVPKRMSVWLGNLFLGAGSKSTRRQIFLKKALVSPVKDLASGHRFVAMINKNFRHSFQVFKNRGFLEIGA